MADICPICDAELSPDHYCLDDFSNFSIELELLDLPFSLEPYTQNNEYQVTNMVTEIPGYLDREERPPRSFSDSNIFNKPSPIFLRL